MLANNSHMKNISQPRRLLEEIANCAGSLKWNPELPVEIEEQPDKAVRGELHAQSEVFGRHFYLISFLRRFHTTCEGYIGVSLDTLQPGDEIWLLPRTCSPFAVRRVPDKRAGNFCSLIGPAFTLGAMYGEILSRKFAWEDIILKRISRRALA